MDIARQQSFRRALLILTIAACLMVWTAVQYVIDQRLETEQQTAETHAWGENAPFPVRRETP
jgi:hypothetical protein